MIKNEKRKNFEKKLDFFSKKNPMTFFEIENFQENALFFFRSLFSKSRFFGKFRFFIFFAEICFSSKKMFFGNFFIFYFFIISHAQPMQVASRNSPYAAHKRGKRIAETRKIHKTHQKRNFSKSRILVYKGIN